MSIIIWIAPWAGMKQWIRVLIGYQSEQNDPALSDLSGYVGYWYWYGILTTSFFFTLKIDRNERKKGTWPITIFISHFRNTHIYREHLSYVAKLAVLLGRGNGRDRARRTTPSAEQANRDSIPVRQWVRQCAGQISSTSQNPFTNHDLPGFFAYPARHRRE